MAKNSKKNPVSANTTSTVVAKDVDMMSEVFSMEDANRVCIGGEGRVQNFALIREAIAKAECQDNVLTYAELEELMPSADADEMEDVIGTLRASGVELVAEKASEEDRDNVKTFAKAKSKKAEEDPFDAYYREISQFKQLTREEEQAHFQAIEKCEGRVREVFMSFAFAHEYFEVMARRIKSGDVRFNAVVETKVDAAEADAEGDVIEKRKSDAYKAALMGVECSIARAVQAQKDVEAQFFASALPEKLLADILAAGGAETPAQRELFQAVASFDQRWQTAVAATRAAFLELHLNQRAIEGLAATAADFRQTQAQKSALASEKDAAAMGNACISYGLRVRELLAKLRAMRGTSAEDSAAVSAIHAELRRIADKAFVPQDFCAARLTKLRQLLLRGSNAKRPNTVDEAIVWLLGEKFVAFRNVLLECAQNRQKMVEANLRLVISVVSREYKWCEIPKMDLVQEGSIGLLRAIEKFEYRRGNKLSTYAMNWIRQAIERSIAGKGRTVRLPVHVCEKISRVFREQKLLRQKFHREPSHEEIATAMGLSIREVSELLRQAQTTVSMQTPLGDDGDENLGDKIADQATNTPEETLNAETRSVAIQNALATALNERERAMVEYRYGFRGENREYTYEDIGQMFGVTRERVRQILAVALRKLRACNQLAAFAC